ncbi:uncharacterized protein [Clytia hemisphaerica]|uniref:CTCK domain-containing protein n=1 Tax=Clytia hemisphaerica TaxID=252671 RepID=A0A7M5WVL2_9CNID|eukprot:TCONS_00071626-protein
MNFNILILLSCFLLAVNGQSKLRTKRVEQDHEQKVTTKRRTKRIGTETDSREKRIRTKRIGVLSKEETSEKKFSDEKFRELILKLLKKIDEKTTVQKEKVVLQTKPTNSTSLKTKTDSSTKTKISPSVAIEDFDTSFVNKDSHSKKVKKHSGRSIKVLPSKSLSKKPQEIISKGIKQSPKPSLPLDNDIHNAASTLYGFCRAQKLRQTFSAKGCENVTVETVVCGGVCQAPLHTFYDIEDIEKAFETCKYCGPLEYEEKLIFLQCYKGTEKRRRWKLEARKMYVPKTCGCIKESCHKLNKVDSGGPAPWQS